ncbi:MAG: carboxypeptidase regulatory-like domain-containing protein [Deltaproteobacteria bacterium]|nr:carboxypeptidase regulatory-like domain-containing protein [Deltaproteobacteria bacterium]
MLGNRLENIAALCFILLPALASAGSLSGTVTRSDTDQAVAGAQVVVRGTIYRAISDTNGNYSIPSLPNGSYGLTCHAPGLRGAATTAVWVPDGTIRDFSLPPPSDIAAIHGLASCAGTPCQAVIISARQDSRTQGIALSSPDGTFSLVGLAPGEYELRGVAYGYLPANVAVTLPAPAVDGGVTLVEQNLDLALGGTYALGGVVALSDNPLDRSNSTVRCNGQIPNLNSVTNTGGSYILEGVPAGPLSFTAYRSGYSSATQIDINMTGDRNINFVLIKDGNGSSDPTFRLEGTVTLLVPDQDGSTPPPPAGSHVSIWNADQTFQRQTTTNPAGEFAIGSIPEGNYLAGASREGFITQTADPFDMTANRTMNFTLELDPDYDWGPGENAPEKGCGCSATQTGGILLAAFMLLLLCRKKWIV